VEYIDQASGKTGDWEAFKRLFADASRRLFDVVVVWALDRFTREEVLETFEYIRDLTRTAYSLRATPKHTSEPPGRLVN
jgi:DNA invertase Pin-like site-specific DNA recombinase